MPRLFVIMPFGTKTHEGAEYDFDYTYTGTIRESAKSQGWEVLRIDELAAPGTISDQYVQELLRADLVLADISIPNASVYYELGIRHSVSSLGTLLISSSAAEHVPFDLRGQRILFFERTASGLEKLGRDVRLALVDFRSGVTTSPIRPVLERAGVLANPETDRSSFERDVASRIERARTASQLIGLWKWLEPLHPVPASQLRDLAERLSDRKEWLYAAEVLRKLLASHPDDFAAYGRLGWFLQQAGPEHDEAALRAYQRSQEINPNDPETLGLMGGREKRRGNLAAAAQWYGRGAELAPNDRYMLVNAAAMKILASPLAPEQGIKLYSTLRDNILRSGADDEWDHVLLGESSFAIGNIDEGRAAYRRAAQIATSPKPLRSAADQLDAFCAVGFRKYEAERLSRLLRTMAADLETGKRPTEHARSKTSSQQPFLIHLSDLHFGSKVPGGKSLHRFFDGENCQPLTAHLAEEFDLSKGYFRIDRSRLYLIVSGDVAYRAVRQEFVEARECLERLCSTLSIPKERVVIVPGNHDVNWTLSQDERGQRFDHFLRFLFDFYGLDLCLKKFPLIDWPLGYSNRRPEPNEILSIHADPTHDVVFLGLNSCVYETHQDHFGFVGEKQMRSARTLLDEATQSSQSTKIAVIHHHLHPYPERLDQREPSETWCDLSTVRDAGFVEEALEDLGIDFVLHGHKHKPQFRETAVSRISSPGTDRKRLMVCGAGSVSCTELEHDEQNQYQVIDLRHSVRVREAEWARLEWRSLPLSRNFGWVTTKAWDIRG